MQDSIHPKRLTRSRRARLLAVATLVSGVLVAGCGGSSPARHVGVDARAAATTARVEHRSRRRCDELGLDRARRRRLGAARVRQVHARQRRAQLPRPERPEAERSSSTCRNQSLIARVQGGAGEVPEAHAGRRPPRPRLDDAPLRTDAGEAAAGSRSACASTASPSSPTPGPRSRPTHSRLSSEITDFDGAILLFPTTINMQAPAYRQALTACGAPPLGLPH